MSRMTWSGFAAVALLAGTPGGAEAQITSRAEATGFTLDLFGMEILAAGRATCEATDPGTDTDTVPEALVPASPLAEVATGEAMCDVTADGTDSSALAEVAESTAVVLPGGNAGQDVVEVVNATCTAEIFCDDDTGLLTLVADADADAAFLGGNEIPVFPDDPPPNTIFLLADPLDILVLNKQSVTDGAFTATGVQVQLVTESEALEVNVAECTVQIENLICPGGCTPEASLVSSLKEIDLDAFADEDDDDDGRADDGEAVPYVITASLTANCPDIEDVVVVDRIPLGTTLDESSIMIRGAAPPPGAVTIADCPDDVSFGTGCADGASGTGRTCLFADLGSLTAANPTATLTFSVDVEDVCESPDDFVCNTAFIQDDDLEEGVARSASVEADRAEADCPLIPTPTPSGTPGPGATPTPTGGGIPKGPLFRTTGGGGCSVVDGGATPAFWPLLALGLFAALRRLGRHPR